MENLPHATDEDRATVAKIVKAAKVGLLTTVSPEGQLHSRPLVAQDVEFDGDLWFFCDEDSNKVREIRSNPEVNVAFSNSQQSEWTSISGRAEVVHDRARAEELWNPMLEVWFEDGLDTPGLALLKVHADTAEYWESSSSRVVRLIGAVRAAATGDPDKFPATNKTVDL